MAPHVTHNPSFGLDITIATGYPAILGPTPNTHECCVILRCEGFDFLSPDQVLGMSWKRCTEVSDRIRAVRGRCDRIACRSPRHKPAVQQAHIVDPGFHQQYSDP